MFRQQMQNAGRAIFLIGWIVFAGNVQAELIAYEGFDYPDDGNANISGRDGGSGWDGGWIHSPDPPTFNLNHDGSLDSPVFPFTPAGSRIVGTGGAARRVLDEPFDLSQDGTFYVSFLLRKDDTGDGGNRNVELALTSAGGQHLVARLGSTSGHQFFLTSTNAADLGPPVEFDATYFLVLKGVAVADGTDQFFAKIYTPTDPSPLEEPSPGDWDLTYDVPTTHADRLLPDLRIAVGNMASGAIDEIRVGRTFASVAVVPEPTSLVLLILGSIVCGGRRHSCGR